MLVKLILLDILFPVEEFEKSTSNGLILNEEIVIP